MKRWTRREQSSSQEENRNKWKIEKRGKQKQLEKYRKKQEERLEYVNGRKKEE